MWCASERQLRHGRRSMTIRIFGELDALDPIFPVNMVCAPMTGTLPTSLIRARRFPTRSCLDTHGCSTDLPPSLTRMLWTWSPICGLWDVSANWLEIQAVSSRSRHGDGDEFWLLGTRDSRHSTAYRPWRHQSSRTCLRNDRKFRSSEPRAWARSLST